jgi:SagB-type dehydrogenase family enzyme
LKYLKTIKLQLPRDAISKAYFESIQSIKFSDICNLYPKNLDEHSVSSFLYYSLANSAIRRSRTASWFLRVNPSAGNLHPTESYLLKSTSIYHYSARDHALQLRADLTNSGSRRFWELASLKDIKDNSYKAPEICIVLSSVVYREYRKYGIRGYRYSLLDIGHAMACVSISALLHGWTAQVLDIFSKSYLSHLLCLDEDFTAVDYELPQTLIGIFTTPFDFDSSTIDLINIETALNRVIESEINRNCYSADLFRIFKLINEDIHPSLEKTCRVKPESKTFYNAFEKSEISVAKVIHKRRSAGEFGSAQLLTKLEFIEIFSSISRSSMYMKCISHWDLHVSMLLFVHSVEDIDSGVYFLTRDADLVNLKAEFPAKSWMWKRTEIIGLPLDLNLFLLQRCDARYLSRFLSGDQELASDGCFSISMICKLNSILAQDGLRGYERVHWESGYLGQMIYLASEVVGVQGNGLGYFFDVDVHKFLGVQDDISTEHGMNISSYQALYHFAVGKAKADARTIDTNAY